MTTTVFDTARAIRPSPIALIDGRADRNAHRHVTTGELVRLQPAVFVAATQWHSLPPWDRYLARVHAHLLIRPDAVAAFESAAALHGLPVFGDPLTVHVLDDAIGSSGLRGGVRTHTGVDDRELVDAGGLRLVGVTDTVVDIARSRHHAVGLAVADAALRRRDAGRAEELVAANESRASSRGRRHARWVAHRATPSSETPLESVSRAAVEWLGFDEPELQRRFSTDGHDDRVDMWWRRARIVGEADGDLKYDGSLQPSVTAIRKEKERDRRLRHHAAGIVHWSWADLLQSAPLKVELLRAGLRTVAPEQPHELLGLRSIATHPRP